jgi:hypothetical protein
MRTKHLEIYLACDMIQRRYGFDNRNILHNTVLEHFANDPTVTEEDVDNAVWEFCVDENDREPNSFRMN